MTRLKRQGEGATRRRATTRLNAVLEKSVFSYATAATAAGVGVLALSQAAQAKIVYTPADVPLPANKTLPVDLNHDGIQDFFFFVSLGSTRSPTTLSVDPVRPNNRILGNGLYASALASGVNVGPGGNFQREHDFMVSNASIYPGPFGSRGPWKGKQDRYLGLKFFIQGEVHYGWARLTINATQFPLTATLTGYAYETEPNTAILTGATSGSDETSRNAQPDSSPPNTATPASLGLLSLGAPGLEGWRSNEEAPARK
jgi:hypothetical protein